MRAPAHSSVQSSSAQARRSERCRRMRRATARPTQPAATKSHAPPLRLPTVRQGARECAAAACAAVTGSQACFVQFLGETSSPRTRTTSAVTARVRSTAPTPKTAHSKFEPNRHYPPLPTLSRFSHLRVLRVCTGFGRTDVGLRATHHGSGASSVADDGGPQESACRGRRVAISRHLAKNRHLRASVLAVCVQEWAVPMSGRALRTLERVRVACRAAARRIRPLVVVAKSRFSRVRTSV